ncbi:hypothetical protein KVT40_009226 [Elsinoe batatas]|uniref:Uncharacterized protein n=1 Tax=Elsinoe batatas TaxID=2601811 RepID=A0A8K0KSA8_9PEZI|nr:hypothetical protein KVT40_009226 [Elsinoe batatas]
MTSERQIPDRASTEVPTRADNEAARALSQIRDFPNNIPVELQVSGRSSKHNGVPWGKHVLRFYRQIAQALPADKAVAKFRSVKTAGKLEKLTCATLGEIAADVKLSSSNQEDSETEHDLPLEHAGASVRAQGNIQRRGVDTTEDWSGAKTLVPDVSGVRVQQHTQGTLHEAGIHSEETPDQTEALDPQRPADFGVAADGESRPEPSASFPNQSRLDGRGPKDDEFERAHPQMSGTTNPQAMWDTLSLKENPRILERNPANEKATRAQPGTSDGPSLRMNGDPDTSFFPPFRIRQNRSQDYHPSTTRLYGLSSVSVPSRGYDNDQQARQSFSNLHGATSPSWRSRSPAIQGIGASEAFCGPSSRVAG